MCSLPKCAILVGERERMVADARLLRVELRALSALILTMRRPVRSWGWSIHLCTSGWEDEPGFPKLLFLFSKSAGRGWPWIESSASRFWLAEREPRHKGVFVWNTQSLGLWAIKSWVLVSFYCQGEKCLRQIRQLSLAPACWSPAPTYP